MDPLGAFLNSYIGHVNTHRVARGVTTHISYSRSLGVLLNSYMGQYYRQLLGA